MYKRALLLASLAVGLTWGHDFAKLSDEELLKIAGTLPASQALNYRMEVVKRLRSLDEGHQKEFKKAFAQSARANLSKISWKEFSHMREQVRGYLAKAKKKHSSKELEAMGLNIDICTGKERRVWCAPKSSH
ncbi:DUF1104 domain-containing protein [Helicobacter baculiformis]|uniref:DUF1104 domain-containing protein n=1 Tax=Helicobacter baculiformis TaxID=427351 RepID=A0ABV7ZFB3_9HELI|nr:DUF1104 domain-containing protein [Helicobacter baculiformis]